MQGADALNDVGLCVVAHVERLNHRYAETARNELHEFSATVAMALSTIEDMINNTQSIRLNSDAAATNVARVTDVLQRWQQLKASCASLLDESPRKKRRGGASTSQE